MNCNIKKVFIAHLFFIPLLFFMTYCSGKSFELIQADGTICKPLKKILKLTGIVHNGTIEDIVQQTQKAWLRKSGTERWQIEDKYEELREELLPLFNKLETLETIYPQNSIYDYCIVFGSLVDNIRNRLAYALELWNQGIRFKKLIFLVGQRPLDPNLESEAILYDYHNSNLPIRPEWQKPYILPKTETDAAKMVFEQAYLPNDFTKTVSIEFIDATGKITLEDIFTRPTTADTISTWLATNPAPGTILAISHQPYVGYQYTVAILLIPKIFSLEVIGKKVTNEELKIAIMLDNLARWLYAEKSL